MLHMTQNNSQTGKNAFPRDWEHSKKNYSSMVERMRAEKLSALEVLSWMPKHQVFTDDPKFTWTD